MRSSKPPQNVTVIYELKCACTLTAVFTVLKCACTHTEQTLTSKTLWESVNL